METPPFIIDGTPPKPIDDGGFAFPIPLTAVGYGMTRRDYFAAAALQGLCANGSDAAATYAREAYEAADAMIARSKKEA